VSERVQARRPARGEQAILENSYNKQAEQRSVVRLKRDELFLIFLKAGPAFGGGAYRCSDYAL
jgi:hypothetical protein